MNKKICFYLSRGHGQGGDPGAVSGKFIERDLAREVTDACYAYIKKAREKKGYLISYPERHMGDKDGQHLYEDNDKTKALNEKYRVVSVDVHFNAGRGNGMECYCKNTSYSELLGELIAEEFKKIGQNFHGQPVRGDNGLMFLKNVGTAVLVECGFVDNKEDRKLFDTRAERVKMGEAIGKALLKYYDVYK